MTIDDESSIYVGGLPSDATEDTIRTVFDLYGAIVDTKIINDQRTRDLNDINRRSMDLSSDSNGGNNDQVSQMEERLEEKELLEMDLQKLSRKLEDELINAKKHSSCRRMQLTKDLVDTAVLESDG